MRSVLGKTPSDFLSFINGSRIKVIMIPVKKPGIPVMVGYMKRC